jgi:hypothetical protein
MIQGFRRGLQSERRPQNDVQVQSSDRRRSLAGLAPEEQMTGVIENCVWREADADRFESRTREISRR